MESSVSAIILSGGKATRMRPFSFSQPKAMIPFLARPLLYYLVRDLGNAGIKDIVVAGSGSLDEINRYFDAKQLSGEVIRYLDCGNSRSGTAGTVKTAYKRCLDGSAAPFLVIYGDSLLNIPYEKIIDVHVRNKASATIAVHSPKFNAFPYRGETELAESAVRRTNYGVVEVGSDGRIKAFSEKPYLDEIEKCFVNPFANAAVYVISPDLLKLIPSNSACDFGFDIFPKMIEEGLRIFAYDIGSGYRFDMGTLPHYYSIQLAALRGVFNFRIDVEEVAKDIWVMQGAQIDRSAILRPPCLIGEYAQISANSHIECSVVGAGAIVKDHVYVERSIILDRACMESGCKVVGSLIGTDVHIYKDIAVPANSVLGSNCRVGGNHLGLSDKTIQGMLRNN